VETYEFWRDRHARFFELTMIDRADDLHASQVEVDLPAILETHSAQILVAIRDSAAPIELVHGLAKTLGRVGRILLDGEKADEWIIPGGPKDRLTRDLLQRSFRAEAAIAAKGADVADGTMTEQAQVEAWLNLIVREKNPHYGSFGIEHLAHASAETCERLASRAYGARADARPNASSRKAVIEPLLVERGWSTGDWASHANVDYNTADDYLNNRSNTRRDTIKKLADALGISPGEMPA
jgi:hypothetical protein